MASGAHASRLPAAIHEYIEAFNNRHRGTRRLAFEAESVREERPVALT